MSRGHLLIFNQDSEAAGHSSFETCVEPRPREWLFDGGSGFVAMGGEPELPRENLSGLGSEGRGHCRVLQWKGPRSV